MPFFDQPASAGLRASRRLRPRSGKHAGGVRPRAGRRAPTASSSTSTCRPTACRSSITTRRSTGRRSHAGPLAARTAAELARVDAGYRFARRRRISVSWPGHRRSRRSRGAAALPGRADHHRDEGGYGGRWGEAVAQEVAPRGRRRSRLCGRLRRAQRRRRAGRAARDREQRQPSGSAAGGLSLVAPVAGSPRRRTAATRCRSATGSSRIVSPRFIRHAHRAGLKVQVWTVDDEARHAPAAGLGRRRLDQQSARPRGPRAETHAVT